MKKYSIALFLIIFAFIAGKDSTVLAQKIIEPNLDYVNNIIKADTLANGKQKDSVFVFRRNAVYFCNNAIDNVGYSITLQAEAGTGRMPMLINWPDASGTLNRMLNAENNAYVYNLYIDGMTGDPQQPYYAMNGQLLRAGAAGKVLVVDGCILNNVQQTIIRSNSGARKVQVTNSTISNMGQLSVDNMGNGRVLDVRNGVTDTVIFRNCTMVNSYDRIFRHYNATTNSTSNFIKYIEFDHNTMVHNLGAFGFIMLGDISGAAKITNNLFYNPFSLGYDTLDASTRAAEFAVFAETSKTGFPIMPLIIDEPNTSATPTFTVSKNVVFYEPFVTSFFSTYKIATPPGLSTRISTKNLGTAPVTTASAVTLKKIPGFMQNVVNWFIKLERATVGGGMITDAKIDMERHTRTFWTDSLDCSYTTANAAFKGTDNLPVGSGKWKSVITGVEKTSSVIPSEFALSNNYPNPFNPTTNVTFSLPVRSSVSLSIYNAIGQEVQKVVDQEFAAGSHSVNINAAGLSSGVYIYTMKAIGENGNSFVSSKKMVVLK